MAITRAQQAKQMLQDGGMLVKPSTDGKRPGYRSEQVQEAREKSYSAGGDYLVHEHLKAHQHEHNHHQHHHSIYPNSKHPLGPVTLRLPNKD